MRQATNLRELQLKATVLGSWVGGPGQQLHHTTPISEDEQRFVTEVQKAHLKLTADATAWCMRSPTFETLWRQIGGERSSQLDMSLQTGIMGMTEAGILRLAKGTQTEDWVKFEPEFVARLQGQPYGLGEFDNAVSHYVSYIWNTSLESRLALLRNEEFRIFFERFGFDFVSLLEAVDGEPIASSSSS